MSGTLPGKRRATDSDNRTLSHRKGVGKKGPFSRRYPRRAAPRGQTWFFEARFGMTRLRPFGTEMGTHGKRQKDEVLADPGGHVAAIRSIQLRSLISFSVPTSTRCVRRITPGGRTVIREPVALSICHRPLIRGKSLMAETGPRGRHECDLVDCSQGHTGLSNRPTTL